MLSLVANQILYPEIVIRSTISIASNLVTSVNYLNSLIKNDSHLQKLLNLNDIIEDIGIIKSFIEEKQKQNSSKTLDICLENLGWLEKEPLKNRYINWIGNIYNGKTFERKWRDYFLWQPYTEVQIDSTILICKKLMEDFNISKKCVGHNTKVNGVNQFDGIVSRSNYTTDVTDLSPAFDFDYFKKNIEDE